jgi:hypothetical protein
MSETKKSSKKPTVADHLSGTRSLTPEEFAKKMAHGAAKEAEIARLFRNAKCIHGAGGGPPPATSAATKS